MPAAMQSSRSSGVACAVRATMRVGVIPSSASRARMRRVAVTPSCGEENGRMRAALSEADEGRVLPAPTGNMCLSGAA